MTWFWLALTWVSVSIPQQLVCFLESGQLPRLWREKKGNIPCYSHLCIRKYVHIKGGALNQLGWWEEIVYFNILGICMILHILYQILPSLVCLVVFFLNLFLLSVTLFTVIFHHLGVALHCSAKHRCRQAGNWHECTTSRSDERASVTQNKVNPNRRKTPTIQDNTRRSYLKVT